MCLIARLLEYCVNASEILCVTTEQSSPRTKEGSRLGCAGVVNPGCSSFLGCRAPSIPEGQDLSRSSSNDSSLASVVEENETETTEDYDTGMVSTFTLHQPHPKHWKMHACIKVSLLCAGESVVCWDAAQARLLHLQHLAGGQQQQCRYHQSR